MMPVGPLMIEHRLIERMVGIMQRELEKINRNELFDSGLVSTAVDFIRTYADHCHHGKEEDILFRDLEAKQMTDEHRDMIGQLKEEHVLGRKTTSLLEAANERFARGDRGVLKDLKKHIAKLVEFYPAHIQKEDKHFFIPCMEYFSREEQDRMLQEFWEFDRTLIHAKYKAIVDSLE